MSFKITDVLYSADSVDADFRSDFQYNVEQWRKSSQYPKTSKLKLRNQKEKIMPNQRDQPYKPKEHQTPKHETKIDPNSVFQSDSPKDEHKKSNAEIPSPISKEMSQFTLAAERPITLLSSSSNSWTFPIQPTNKPKPPNVVTSMTDNNRQVLNPVFRLFETEEEMQKLEEEMKSARKQRHQDDLRKKAIFLTMPKINVQLSSTKSYSKGPQLINDDFYYNSLVEHGDWSVIWDLNKISSIPLLFDKSDKFIASNNDSGSNHVMREWNTLNLLDPKRQYYSNMITQNQHNNEMNFTNSDVANSLALIEPNITDFEHFHHPALNVEINKIITVKHLPLKETKEESTQLNSLKELSARQGDVFLVEYTAENPAFLLNIGMNAILITYFRKQTEDDIPHSASKLINLKILGPNDASPFGAQLPPAPIQALYCKLFRMPICQHELNKQDFLLVKDPEQDVFYIRPFQSIFCGGLIEPQAEVITPSSKKAQELQEKFMRAFLINIYRDTPNSPARQQVQVNQIQQLYFPDVNEQRLRKILKEYAEFNRNSGIGYWRVKLDNDQLNAKFQKLGIGPEEVCNLQSMIVGKWKLRKNGVNILYTPPKNIQIQKLKGFYTKKVAGKIEIELMKAPWTKTGNFQLAFKNRAVEMDSENGETIYRKKSRKQKSANPDGEANKRQLAGTSSDLRSLSLKQIDALLIEAGVVQTKLSELKRWGKVRLLKQLANRQKQDNKVTEIANAYARGPRNDYQAAIEKYKQQYQQTFDNNLNFISIKNAADEKDGDLDANDLLEIFGLDLIHTQMEEEEDDLDTSSPEQATKAPIQFQSTDDPPQLKPYTIYTSPTNIDWSKYGFEPQTTPMRDVLKLIHTSFSKETGVDVRVEWNRSQQIQEFKKKPSVFQETNLPLAFNDAILKERRKQLLEKLRKKKPLLKQKAGGKQESALGYIPTHTFLLVQEDANSQFSFHFTPEVIDHITKAKQKYEEYRDNYSVHGRPTHSTKSYSNVSHRVDDSQKKKKRSTLGQFNDALKQIIQEKGQTDFINFYAPRDPIDGEQPPTLKEIETKCSHKEYSTSKSFIDDIERIKYFYRNRVEGKSAKELYSRFVECVQSNQTIRKLEKLIAEKRVKREYGK